MLMRTSSLLALVFVASFTAGVLHGCGGSSGAKPTPKCVLGSDCSGNLVCALGYCVNACNNGSKDCNAGELCVKNDSGNFCRATEVAQKHCALNSECESPLVCGRDLTCRVQCAKDVDCPTAQKCTVGGTCADPAVDFNYDPITNDYKKVTTGTAGTTGAAGTGSDGGAGTTGVAGTTGAAGDGGNAGTTGEAGTTGAAGTGTDGGADAAAGTTGAAGSGTDGGGQNPDAAQTVDGVMVTPTDQLRQGQSGQQSLTITISKAAGGLGNASILDFGGVTGKVDTANSTATKLVIKASAPHGLAPGKRTLKVSTQGGVVTEADVIEVTPITAGPAGSDADGVGFGTTKAPYRSLKVALGAADVGDTISLLDGKYSVAASAESWGYTLPTDITIVGQSTANTIIDGVGATGSPDGFDITGKLKLQTLSVQHFRYGIDTAVANSSITLQDVYLGGNSSYGIYIEQAAMGTTLNVLGKNSTIDQPGQTALYIYNVPNVTVNVTDATVQGGSQVVQASYGVSALNLTFTGATVKQLSPNYSAFYIAPSNNQPTSVKLMNCTIAGNVSYSDAKGSLTIAGSTITQVAGAGVSFSGMTLAMSNTTVKMVNNSYQGLDLAGAGTMTLTGVTVDGGNYNVQQSGAGSSMKVRGSTFKNSYYDGYYITAGDLDFGTATEDGNNALLAPSYSGGYAFYISRPSGAASGNPITSSASAIGTSNNVPGAKTIDATGTAQSQAPQLWYVAVPNKLIFY
jgi:hypothetical protein